MVRAGDCQGSNDDDGVDHESSIGNLLTKLQQISRLASTAISHKANAGASLAAGNYSVDAIRER
jgi:hypothetical protein